MSRRDHFNPGPRQGQPTCLFSPLVGATRARLTKCNYADVPGVFSKQTGEYKAGANTPLLVGGGGGGNDNDSLVQPQGDPLVNISSEPGLKSVLMKTHIYP